MKSSSDSREQRQTNNYTDGLIPGGVVGALAYSALTPSTANACDVESPANDHDVSSEYESGIFEHDGEEDTDIFSSVFDDDFF